MIKCYSKTYTEKSIFMRVLVFDHKKMTKIQFNLQPSPAVICLQRWSCVQCKLRDAEEGDWCQ